MPSAIAVVAGDSSALVAWTAPADGGSAITGYTVTASPGGARTAAAGTATSATILGLANGTAYTFTVTGSNATGSGAASAPSAAVTPAVSAVPIMVSPRRVALTLSQNRQFTVNVTGIPTAGVTWKVDGTINGSAAAGTVNAGGLYTPPATGGTHTITATSQADSSKVASATIGVTDLAGVFTYHNDIARTGQNLQEYALDTTNVKDATAFGKLFSCQVDGTIYAQPLYVANLSIGGGVHNVVFVATEKDSVYAFDADSVDSGGNCINYWYRSFLSVGVTAVPTADVDPASTPDLPGTLGITGTPVIGNGVMYMVARFKNVGTSTYSEQLRALNLADGTDIVNSPTVIAASFPGIAQGGNTVTFDAKRQSQRPALLLLNNVVYVAFGSAGDQDPYNGWLLGYHATTLAQLYVFNSTPNGGGAGRGAFWMSGSGPASDGTSIFAATANGDFDNTNNIVPLGVAGNDMGESLLKFNSALVLQDFFTPSTQAADSLSDLDFGSGGVVVLPDSMGSAAHRQLVVAMGKTGNFYMEDRHLMGRYLTGNGGVDGNVQTLYAASSPNLGIWATPAVWGGNLYIAPFSSTLRAFAVVNGSINAPSMQTPDVFQGLGATPSISAAGTGSAAANSGIVWALDNSASGASFGNAYGPAILRAYDAISLGPLYSSANTASETCGNAVKFTVPTVANGKVYVGGGAPASLAGTTGQLTVYGLKP